MTKNLIDVGDPSVPGSGDTLYDGAGKINENFNEIYSSLGDGNTLLDIVNSNLEFDLKDKSNKISFLYANKTELDEVDFQEYEGSVAYVRTTGSLYVATNDGWQPLLNNTDSSVTNANYIDPLKGVVYEGTLSSLEDVDENVTPQDGYVLKWNSIKNLWEPAIDIAAVANNILDLAANGINVEYFDGQSSEYYLNYNNFINVPTIPSSIDELSGANTLVVYDSNTNTLENITTDNVEEGNTNLYYTTSRFVTDLADNYAAVTQFDCGYVVDSVDNVTGTFTNLVANQSNTISSVSNIDVFRVNDMIRLYGAYSDDSVFETDFKDNDLTLSVELNGFEEGNSAIDTTFTYIMAEFEISTGKISAKHNDKERTVSFNFNKDFNLNNNIKITITGLNAGRGILLYRKIDSNPYQLYAVLTTKDLVDSTYIDFYDFDYPTQSPKKFPENTYRFGLNHFPLTPPDNSLQGWIDACVTEVDKNNSTLKIDTLVYPNSNRNVEIVHNDTQLIQQAINGSKLSGKNYLRLNDKTYIVESLTIPDNFALIGIPHITTLKKLPWSSGNQIFGDTNNILVSENYNSITGVIEGSTRSTISDIIIDANRVNSFLIPDLNNNEYLNYVINLGVGSNDCEIDAVRILESIGGGIYAPQANNIFIHDSEIARNTLSDFNSYNPLYATEIKNSRIIGNKFTDYTGNVDVTVADKLVVTNNIISACGSGLSIYGSKFLISYPNMLLGYGKELLPTPDILNSEYDSVNLYLTSNMVYTSDVYVYQENGEAFNLIQNEKNNIKYEIYSVLTSANGSTSLTEFTLAKLNDVAGMDRTNGEFRFSITKNDVNTIKQELGTKELIYQAKLEEYVKCADILGSGTISGTNYVVNVSNLQYVSNESTVYIGTDHGGLFGDRIGTIVDINAAENQVTISGLDLPNQFNIGSGGTLNIVNEFILAQGRLL